MGHTLARTLAHLGGLLGVALLALAFAAPNAGALRIDVSGSHLVDGGKKVRLIGVNRSGSEYSCSGDDGQGGHGYDFFQGPVSDRAIKAMKKWKINAVALPLNEACWLGDYGGLNPSFVGQAYRQAIEGYVDRLNAHGIYVVLRLSGAGPGNNVYGAAPGDAELPMADADHSLAFWSSVATTFTGNHAVLFHAYDEPHKISWDCVLNGCPVNADGSEGEPAFGPYTAAGHQAIVDAIRNAGATQPIIVSGIDFAGDVDQWEDFMPNDPLGKLVVGWNSFDYSGNFGSSKPALRSLARSHPIVVGGFGDTDCDSSYSSKLMRFADGQGISYLAWTWNTEADYGGCSNALLGPKLSAYYSAKPSGYGKGVRRHFRAVMGKKHH
jgi:endoglucanase